MFAIAKCETFFILSSHLVRSLIATCGKKISVKKVKQLATALALVPFIISSSFFAQASPKKKTVEQLAMAVSDAYTWGVLGWLDRNKHDSLGKVKIIIKHSIAIDKSETKEFKSFEQAEQWLRSREDKGRPVRVRRPLLGCQKSLCTYNFEEGLLHGHLYLQKITYGYNNGSPYIATIHLLDGD